MEELLWTATVKSPFGITGEVKIHAHNDDCSYLGKLKEVVLRAKDGTEQRLAIQSFRMQGSQALMKFAGFDDPETARALNGQHLLVERSKAAPLKKGQYYVADLIGCVIWCMKARLLQKWSAVWMVLRPYCWKFRTAEDQLYMVPYLKEYIGEVDLQNRTIELKDSLDSLVKIQIVTLFPEMVEGFFENSNHEAGCAKRHCGV